MFVGVFCSRLLNLCEREDDCMLKWCACLILHFKKKKTFTKFYFSTNMDYFEGKNYNHADNAPKYIVFMACNANIAGIETQLY